jgi:hypothetical protein
MSLEDDLFASLEEEFSDVSTVDVEDFSLLDAATLGIRISEVTAQMREINEFREPRTSEGRELHALYYSLRQAYLEKNLGRRDSAIEQPAPKRP